MNATVQDNALYNQLPFYLVKNEVPQFAKKSIFDQLYGDVSWLANEGPIMKGVTPQRSPVGRSFFFPNPITTLSNKDINQVTESTEQAILYKHRQESFQFNFIPNFTVFWKTYLQFADTDIVNKIALSNNQFIETQMWQATPNVYLCGSGLVTAPVGTMNITLTGANSKTAAWLIATVNGVGPGTGVLQSLTLRDVYRVVMNLQEDMGAPSFSGSKNMPTDNEGLKSKYALLTSSENFLNWTFDPDVQTLKPLDLNILFNDFKGCLFGTVTTKILPYPIRFNVVDIVDGAGGVLWAAGFPISPEIFDATDNKWKPNPYYTSLVSAPYTLSWLLGDGVARTVKVGPPPKEFASNNMSAAKFYPLKWNGEVRLTDQFLISMPDGSQDLNTYGEQLKFQSQLTYGYLPCERRFAIAIISERKRPVLQVV